MAALVDRVDLCRLVTCGSVDDGKSTLIGRLLYDSKQVMTDQLEHIEEVSERRGDGYVNLALLTDGLRAEREQGITIDVAYRPFATPLRRFIIADSPGHVQYTRNMATGASTADVAVILVDARHGVVEQTRRHTYVCALLRIPRVVVAVNKMDLVEFDRVVFDDIEAHFRDFAKDLDIEIDLIPISALDGDNVVDDSERMPWYEGTSLLHHLERIPLDRDDISLPARYPVQWVIRPQAADHHDYRGYAGQIAAGDFRPGMDVVVLPGGQRTSVASVETVDGPLEVAEAPQSVTIRLAENLDVARGDMIVATDDLPVVSRELVADVCWMSDRQLAPGSRYVIRHTTREARAVVEAIVHRVDIHTFNTGPAESIGLNDIARIRFRTSHPLVVDAYGSNRTTGSFILIDDATNDTLAAGMIVEATPTSA
jgi:sulfate adenylyltransferase large subunit